MKKLMALMLSFAFVLCLGGCSSKAASIGIIGGADGPTAIFVTSKISWMSVCCVIGALIVAVLVALIIYRSKKKK